MSLSKNLAANLLIPTKRCNDLSLPVGPDDDLIFVPLTTKTTGELTAPASGKGVILFYPATCARKIGEVWGDDGAGGLVFLRYITESVDLSQNFTYGRVVKRTITIEQNQVLATGSGTSASVQGILGGTVVQGGISQLYEAGVPTADTFSIGNLSQLSGNPAYSLMSVRGSEGVGFNLPIVNRDFARIDDDAPGGDADDYAENIDTSRPNVTHLKWTYHNDLPPTWDGSAPINLESTSFSIDVPYHGIISFHAFLNFTVNIPMVFKATLHADFYALDRSVAVLSKELAQTFSYENVLPTLSGEFVFPGRNNDIHETYTAVKFRIDLEVIGALGEIVFNIGSLLSTVTSPLYKGMGYTQKPLLVPFEGFSADAPMLYRIMSNYELTPDTAQSKITQAKQRNLNTKLYKKIDDAQNLFVLSGGSFLWKSAVQKGAYSASSYEKEINMILDYEFHSLDEAMRQKFDPEEHGADFSFNFIKSLENLGRGIRKGFNTVYQHGGRELIGDALSTVPIAGSIAKAHLPAKFASGATFGAKFMMGKKMDNYEDFVIMKRPNESSNQIYSNHNQNQLTVPQTNETRILVLDDKLRKLPHVFVPGIFDADQGNRGLFVLMQCTPWMAEELRLKELEKTSWTSKYPIYGHTGEKWDVSVPYPLLLAEVVDLSDQGHIRKIQVAHPGTGRSLGLAVLAMSVLDQPLYMAFTGDVARNLSIDQMNPIIIAKKLMSLPSNMMLVTRTNMPNNSRIVNYTNSQTLVKDLKNLVRDSRNLTKPMFAPGKQRNRGPNKPKPKAAPKTQNRASPFRTKPISREDYTTEVVRRANPLFFPSGKWQYEYDTPGNAFFRGSFYLKTINFGYDLNLNAQTLNAAILKSLYTLGLIRHSGAGIKSSASDDLLRQAQEEYQKIHDSIKDMMPDLANAADTLKLMSALAMQGKGFTIVVKHDDPLGFVVQTED